MDLTIKTFSDLLQILDQRPEWRLKLRESLYPEADIPKALRELAAAEQRLAEAQRRTQEALEGLTTRDKAREREFEKFDERHRKSMEELDRIKEIVLDSIARDQARQRGLDDLKESHRKSVERLDRIEVAIDRLTVRGERTEEAIEQFTTQVDGLESNVDNLTNEFHSFKGEVKGEFRSLRQEMREEFALMRRNLTQQIGKLGGRWGINNESIWRQTIATLIEDTYGDRVEEMWIEGDQFDVVISNGDHILLEITARFKSNDVAKVIRKRDLYTRHYQAPTRFIVAAAAIHSRQVIALQNEGFEVIEPEVE